MPLEAQKEEVPAGLSGRVHRYLMPVRTYLEAGGRGPTPASRRIRAGAFLYLLSESLRKSDIAIRSAATAFTLVFALVPLIATSLAFFSAFSGMQGQRSALQTFLYTHLLPTAVDEVQRQLDTFAEAAGAAGAVSSLVFFATILLLFQSVEETFNRIWHAEMARTWSQRLQGTVVFFLTGTVITTVVIALSHEGESLALPGSSGAIGSAGVFLSQVVRAAGDILASWFTFILAIRTIPNVRVRWKPALLGGIVAGTFWHTLKGAFTFYVVNLASFENMYGALGTVPAFLLWLYLTILVLLFGAHVAFVAQNFYRLLMEHPRPGSHYEAFFSVMASARLAEVFRGGGPPQTAESVAESLGILPSRVSRILDSLSRRGLVHRFGTKGGGMRYVLAQPPESITLGNVVQAVSGVDLDCPPQPMGLPFGSHVRKIFDQARSPDHNCLEKYTLGDLETTAGSHIQPIHPQ